MSFVLYCLPASAVECAFRVLCLMAVGLGLITGLSLQHITAVSRNESKDGFAITAGLRPQWWPQMEDGGAGMKYPGMGPREQTCMLAEKERSSLESDLPSLLQYMGMSLAPERLSVEGPMSTEWASLCHTLSISIGRTEDIYTIDVNNALTWIWKGICVLDENDLWPSFTYNIKLWLNTHFSTLK